MRVKTRGDALLFSCESGDIKVKIKTLDKVHNPESLIDILNKSFIKSLELDLRDPNTNRYNTYHYIT